MKKKHIVRKILIAIIIVLLLSQFIQPPKNAGNAMGPKDITHVVTVPDSVMAILKVACYDCHSDSTRYPWYNHITPVNWWLRNHINQGKRHLNFTVFDTLSPKRKLKRMDDIVEDVKTGDMPLSSYLWIHTDAKLSDQQKQMLISWAENAKAQLPKAQ